MTLDLVHNNLKLDVLKEFFLRFEDIVYEVINFLLKVHELQPELYSIFYFHYLVDELFSLKLDVVLEGLAYVFTTGFDI